MKILLVDDHELVLEGIKNFLQVCGYNVVGTAKSALEAMLKVEMLEPEMILMDIQMAECDGITATRQIKTKYPQIVIVMLTACEDEDNIFAAIQAGASGYLIKSMESGQFLRQLEKLKDGEAPLVPNLGKRLLQEFNSHKQTETNANQFPWQQLTERQQEILQFVTDGMTYKEIALRLDIKEITVKCHVRAIIDKLHVNNRAQLIALASRHELTSASN